MHFLNSTTNLLKRTFFIIFFIFTSILAIGQENSPYSRYGIGDLVPNQNMVSRSMGGITAGVNDYQSLNLVNPAALTNVYSTIFDIGGEIDIRTLRSNLSPVKYSSTNTLISYLQLGFPIASQKMKAKGNHWGVSLGLRPVSRINYKIEENKRVPGADSINTLYEGSGGLNQVNISTGLRIKKLSIGVSTGYSFGNKDYSTKINPVSDSIIYYNSNTAVNIQYGGVFFSTGLQYDFKLKKGSTLTLGAYGTLQQDLKAKRDRLIATVAYGGSGEVIIIDTVSYQADVKGTLTIPAVYGLGFTFTDKDGHWLAGADIEMGQWSKYRQYGETDFTQNNWRVKAGAQYYPASSTTQANKYWSFVKYRAGAYYGVDYIKLNSSNRPEYGITLGAGLPLTSFQRLRFGEYVTLNAGLEVGARGNKESASVREGLTRITIGVSANAKWFQRRKYD